jgi:hypothetical protein
MKSLLGFTLLCIGLGLSACGGDDDDGDDSVPPVRTGEHSDGKDSGSGSAKPSQPEPKDAGTASDPDPDPGAGEQTTVDRCLAHSCAPARLPVQPELEFLADMGDGWQRLMEVDWELAASSEGYRCMTFTVPEDVYIIAFNPQSPLGTHHSTYGISASANGPDKVVACGVGNAGERRLQGSGAGSEPSNLPAGVAMPVHRGEQIMMNLHLFNVSDQVLRGRSGMWIKTVAKGEVEHEAEQVLAGPLQLNIPVGRSTQKGGCTLRADATLYALAPHMHQKGVHLRATATSGGEEIMVYDGEYDFSHQLLHDIDDVQLKAGDRVNIECTYQNDSDGPLRWGDSSLDEMCFIGMSLYPAIGYGSLPCSN